VGLPGRLTEAASSTVRNVVAEIGADRRLESVPQTSVPSV
jgi:hypothetical protein